jgi:hypothetical protein
MDILKYPRTPHLQGSRLQEGDSEADQVALESLIGQGLKLTWEEKIDGANCGLSFNESADLLLQSRGHFLCGGTRERQFDLFKSWANYHIDCFFDRLGSRYIVYGEWCFEKHTIFYNCLPHYFLEFDIYDRVEGVFLSTKARRQILHGLPIVSVPVLRNTSYVKDRWTLRQLVKYSLYKSPNWRVDLHAAAERANVRWDLVMQQTDQTNYAEGLYLKVEK